MGISDATFYNWKKKYGGLGVSEVRRLRQLEEENRKLKQLVADLSLDKAMLQDVIQKSSEAGTAQGVGRPSAASVPSKRSAFVRGVEAIARGVAPPGGATEAGCAIDRRIQEIAQTRVRYGARRIHILLRREGWKVNHKRVHRLYVLAGLNLRAKRPRRRKAAADRLERPELTAPNQSWSMDFVSDALFDGRRFRGLTVVENFNRECLAIAVGAS